MLGKPLVQTLVRAFAERKRRVCGILDLRQRRKADARQDAQFGAAELPMRKLRPQQEPTLQIAGLDISRGGVSKIEVRLRFVEDKDLTYLAEVLEVPVPELFPQRESARRLAAFMEKLETTRF